MNSKPKTLVFSIAFKGYQYLYENFLASHQAYAERFGYNFLAISKPGFCFLGMECAWLKLSVLHRALQLGYDTVMFVDADACIAENAPAIESCLQAGKYLYMARGYSGRFNSGVIIARNHAELREDLRRLLAAPHTPIPAEDQVGWGENGHLIHLARRRAYVGELDWRWNNNYQLEQADFIRHYSAGPMRALLKAPHWGVVRWWCCQILVRGLLKLLPASPRTFAVRLNAFANRLFRRYGLESNLTPAH